MNEVESKAGPSDDASRAESTPGASLRARPRPECPVCGRPGLASYRDLVDSVWGAPGRWNLSRCGDRGCEMRWLDPVPGAEDIGVADQEHTTRAGVAASVAYLSGEARGRLLDVGCGAGDAIARLREVGWDAEGVDPDPRAVEVARARGLRVALGTLAGQGYPPDHFDAVTLGHVIERVPEPRSVIEESFRILTPGGRLVIETANAGALCHLLFGPNWRGLEPPRHLQVFTLAALGRLIRESGFHIERGETSSRGARFFAAASMAIASARRGNSITRDRWGAAIGALATLVAASEVLLLALVPDVGEELVLVARKPAVAYAAPALADPVLAPRVLTPESAT